MKIHFFTIIILLVLPKLLVGQYIGVYAKKDGKLCFDKPIFTEEDTDLTNKLMSAEEFCTNTINYFKISVDRQKGMAFSKEELKALKCNFVQDNADYYIEYKSNDLPADFYAIGTECNDDRCFVYHPKYKQYENWASYKTTKGAVIKMMKLLHIQVKESEEVDDYLLYDYECLNTLYGILKTINSLYQPDEIALIIAAD